MSEWSEGYVTEIDYIVGFCPDITPQMLQFCLLAQGISAPCGSLSYLELGCGNGLTSNIIAATNPDIEVVAVDFNPAHIKQAQALADSADIKNVRFLERSFQELVKEDALPSFDIIVLHGVYSWVSAANRGYIRDIIRRHLKPGGAVYVSYNAYPGWSAGATLQRVIYDGGKVGGGTVPQQLHRGVGLLNRLKELNAAFFHRYPEATGHLEHLQKMPIAYLAHEYINRDWNAFYFSDIARELEEAKVVYGASANLAMHADLLNLTEDQRKLLSAIPETSVRELTRDLILNTSFRRDIFVRGLDALSRSAQKDIWNTQRFVLLQDPVDIPRKLSSLVGEVTLNADVYDAVLNALSDGPKTLGELIQDKGVSNLKWEQVAEAMQFLVILGAVHLALPAEGQADREVRARAINLAIAERIKNGLTVQALASPVTGSGINIDNLSQLFIVAHWAQEEDKLSFVHRLLKDKGHNLLKDGKAIEDEEAEFEHLREALENFERKTFKVLQRLGIV